MLRDCMVPFDSHSFHFHLLSKEERKGMLQYGIQTVPELLRFALSDFARIIIYNGAHTLGLACHPKANLVIRISLKITGRAKTETNEHNVALWAVLVRMCYETWSFHCFQGKPTIQGMFPLSDPSDVGQRQDMKKMTRLIAREYYIKHQKIFCSTFV